jgi:hypothetical protein
LAIGGMMLCVALASYCSDCQQATRDNGSRHGCCGDWRSKAHHHASVSERNTASTKLSTSTVTPTPITTREIL